jgi:hypothetical protein
VFVAVLVSRAAEGTCIEGVYGVFRTGGKEVTGLLMALLGTTGDEVTALLTALLGTTGDQVTALFGGNGDEVIT